jgi:hypothetical protein
MFGPSTPIGTIAKEIGKPMVAMMRAALRRRTIGPT